jgi:hypothetical protein
MNEWMSKPHTHNVAKHGALGQMWVEGRFGIWNLGIQLTLRFSITTMPIEAACHLACYHLVQAFLRKTEPSNSQPWIHIYTYTHNTHICMTLAQHLYIDLYCDVGCLEGKHGFWS